ncbi:hypothetical protein HIM_06143 [Hirsutella minnesotensis 3608]|uniref:RNA helicase n=1 Tax=Hirsutella minnesotensis 3608 TaxID=1043627 RepID=A0A0F7ZZN8_9HYPO|nr:hypothetical protein HIM_06143 [Hirsutella minnesotensis 3608]
MNHLARVAAFRVASRAPPSRALSTTLKAARRNPTKQHGAEWRPRDHVDRPAVRPARARHHNLFHKNVLSRYKKILARERAANHASQGLGPLIEKYAAPFADELNQAFELAGQGTTGIKDNHLYCTLRESFAKGNIYAFDKDLFHAFQSFIARHRFTKDVNESMKRLVDFRFPHEFFPATRTMQRTIHVHVGPTNSGKTYNALKALEASQRGVYAGPLRLLANEVQQRLEAKGYPCALITGEEVRTPADTDRFFISCTVEMIPLNKVFDVAVIDEIQMIESEDRGSAWTNALLGVQAKEVHVCGEDRTVNLLQSLCASVGDKCIVHRYERLSPLKTMDRALGDNLDKLEKGDAIVAFSRINLHAYKQKIERATGRRCAIVYGSLPPDVRVKQAALFNNPDNDYDFIVASDAIGMGLNLEIRRVIFSAITKYDSNGLRRLTAPELRQIGGRAGRYRTAANANGTTAESSEPRLGLVTTFIQSHIRQIGRMMQSRPRNIEKAAFFPPAGVIERFASYFPLGTPLSWILHCINATATVSPQYHLNIPRDILELADQLQDLPLSIYDRLTFCHLPVSLRTAGSTGLSVLRALATIVAEYRVGHILSIKEIPLEHLELDVDKFVGSGSKDTALAYLSSMEQLHVAINQYVWLSYRFAGMFPSRALAFHIRSLVEEKLIEALERMDFTKKEAHNGRINWRRLVEAERVEVDMPPDQDDLTKFDNVDFDLSLLNEPQTSPRSVGEESRAPTV